MRAPSATARRKISTAMPRSSVPRRAFAGRRRPHDLAHGDHHLRPRIRRGLDALRAPVGAGQGRPADADLGEIRRRLARGGGACEPDRPAEGAHEHRHANCGYRALGWPRKTLAEELRLQLADEIVRGALAPGAALDETGLARRFQVSRTPVREAIRLLAASGLVEARAHRAALVARPSAGASRRHVRGDGGARSALRRLCRRAHDRRRAARAGGQSREPARADPERRSADATTRSTRRFTPASMPARTTAISPT